MEYTLENVMKRAMKEIKKSEEELTHIKEDRRRILEEHYIKRIYEEMEILEYRTKSFFKSLKDGNAVSRRIFANGNNPVEMFSNLVGGSYCFILVKDISTGLYKLALGNLNQGYVRNYGWEEAMHRMIKETIPFEYELIYLWESNRTGLIRRVFQRCFLDKAVRNPYRPTDAKLVPKNAYYFKLTEEDVKMFDYDNLPEFLKEVIKEKWQGCLKKVA